MKALIAALRLDSRHFGSGARGAAIGLVFWSFVFAAALLNILGGSGGNFSTGLGDYFAFSLLFFSMAFVLATVADLLHDSMLGVAVVLRSLSVLDLIVAGVIFLVGVVYTTSGLENVAVIVGIFVMLAFGILYLLRERDKHQDQP